MSLQEKIEKYSQSQSSSNVIKEAGKEIIAELRSLGTELSDDNALPETTESKLKKLHDIYLQLPHMFFYNYSQDLLEVILDISSENIYKLVYDNSFDFQKNPLENFPIKSRDSLVLFMLVHYLDKIAVKELFGYLKAYSAKKQKNPQLILLIIELLHYVLLKVEKKDLYLNDLLPTLLKTLNPSLGKYIKYKNKVENNQYVQTPKHIVQYLRNYENWAKPLLH